MTSKEAIAIVLEVGPSMGQAAAGDCSALQTSLEAIDMILQRKLFSESKDEVSLILFGTVDTANDLAQMDTGYENICVAKPLAPVDWSILNYIQNDVQPSTETADVLDALVVAMDHLMQMVQGRKGFGSKRVILFTDMGGQFADDQLDGIIGSMKDQQMEFNVIGPQLDGDTSDDSDDGGGGDARPGPSSGHGKPKTAQQKKGETVMKKMVSELNGESYSFREALSMLSFSQSRQVKPTAWKCQLEVTSDLKIPICGYSKMKEVKPKSFKNVYAKNVEAEVQRSRTHFLNDDAETEVDKSDVVDGLRYGSTLVPFSDEDKDAMKVSTTKCLKVLGFTKTQNVPRHHLLGDSNLVIVAEKTDEAAKVALSAFIQSLYETESVMIVRRVYANNSPVRLGCLRPHIKANWECLFYNEIPFAEDLRQLSFGSLPITEDVSPANKKSTPSDEQLTLMDDLLDEMDLSFTEGDEGGKGALNPKLTFNPFLQRLFQCLLHRALYPDDALPELSPKVEAYLKPPQQLVTECKCTLGKMEAAFKLQDVKKEKDKIGNVFVKGDGDRLAGAPPSKRPKMEPPIACGIADLVTGKVTEVGSARPIEDFNTLISKQDEDHFDEACRMMQQRIIELVKESFGRLSYGKALDCVQALRAAAIKNMDPDVFNVFLRQFKTRLTELAKTDFWDDLVTRKLGLISSRESDESLVTRQEAEEFLATVSPKKEPLPSEHPVDDDPDDLLDCL